MMDVEVRQLDASERKSRIGDGDGSHGYSPVKIRTATITPTWKARIGLLLRLFCTHRISLIHPSLGLYVRGAKPPPLPKIEGKPPETIGVPFKRRKVETLQSHASWLQARIEELGPGAGRTRAELSAIQWAIEVIRDYYQVDTENWPRDESRVVQEGPDALIVTGQER